MKNLDRICGVFSSFFAKNLATSGFPLSRLKIRNVAFGCACAKESNSTSALPEQYLDLAIFSAF